jgi:hypothetical protein
MTIYPVEFYRRSEQKWARWVELSRSRRGPRTEVAAPMSGRAELLPQHGTAWLLAIGQRLRAEYAALEEPVPERLAALVASA